MRDNTPRKAIKPASYSVVGTGELLVLIHGVGLNKDVWAPQIECFSRSNRVIAYDMLGHGDSPLPEQGVTLNAYVHQLTVLLDEMGISAANVIGHSMGALVALGFALSHSKRALRVVALSAVYDRTAEQRSAVIARAQELERVGPTATSEQTVSRWFGQDVIEPQAETAAQVRRWLEAVNPVGYARTYRVFATSDDAFVGKLGRLQMPALFMTGELDPNSTPEMARRMANDAPLGQATIVKGECHMMTLTAPDLVNELLLAFLAQPLVRSAPGR